MWINVNNKILIFMLLAGNAQRIYIERSRVEIKRQCLGVRTERLQKSTQRRRVGWGKLKRGGTAGNKGSVPWSVWATQPSCSTPIHPASLNPKSPPYSWRFWNNSKMELLPHNALPKPLPSHKTKKLFLHMTKKWTSSKYKIARRRASSNLGGQTAAGKPC